jgi:hypothetical protein
LLVAALEKKFKKIFKNILQETSFPYLCTPIRKRGGTEKAKK